MGLPRSTFYDAPIERADDAQLVARMAAICDEFECYGYRRVGAALRQQGVVVNSKKVHRLMREHQLQPTYRRRFVATTDNQPVDGGAGRGRGAEGRDQFPQAARGLHPPL